MKIKIQPWQTPNFLIGQMPDGRRQDGFNPDAAPKWALAEVDTETLAEQCDAFRAEVFRKAGKPDPAAFIGRGPHIPNPPAPPKSSLENTEISRRSAERGNNP